MENTYLVGFMGCGKTTIGEQLSSCQGRKFYDLDTCIVQRAGMPISKVFEVYGEDYFRKLETACLKATSKERGAIIATGGGIVTREENRLFLKGQKVIFLNWPFELLYERIRGDSKRPLVTTEEALRKLYDARQGWYEEVATYSIDCKGHTPYSLSRLLTEQIK
ncbi:MAG: shikimate kinase [Cellulosilyticaceae bacterium]